MRFGAERRRIRLALAGFLCLTLWLLSLRISGSEVLAAMERFAIYDDGRYLLGAAVLLVLFNTFRAVFLYLGWFYLGESLALSQRGSTRSWLLPLMAIPASYIFVSWDPAYFMLDLGLPAFFSILTVVVLHLSTREIAGWTARTLVICLLLFSFQWLDLVPGLTHWGFGRGELSLMLKDMALLSEWDWVLDALGIGGFACSFAGAVAAAALLIGAKQRDRQFRKILEQDRAISLLREQTVRDRGYVEAQQLVHDLRRPLTTMLGLGDVLVATLSDNFSKQYAQQMVDTGELMNRMIHELLEEESQRRLPVLGVVDYVLSQISAFSWRHSLSCCVETDATVFVRVNLMRFSRALVNVLENAHTALEGRADGVIQLRVESMGEHVSFCVEDNGRGFPQARNPGTSQWGSTGLGLIFVEEVLKKHGGTMEIGNLPEGGARICLLLRAERGG